MNGYVEKDGQKFLWIGKRSDVKQTYPGMLDHLVAGGLVCIPILLLIFLFTVVTKIFAAAYGCQKFMNFSTCIPCLCAPYDLWCHFRSKTIKLDFINDGILKLQFENVQPQINKCTSFTYSFPFPRGPNFLQSLKGHREYSLC